MHATLEKFGYPDTLIRSYGHWSVVLRPAQVTVGSLVLAHNGPEERFAELSPEAFAEMHVVIGDIESTLRGLYAFDKINYLMLMMSDPQVHFHVIPRYAQPVALGEATFTDVGWPGQPLLGEAAELSPDQFQDVLAGLRAAWP